MNEDNSVVLNCPNCGGQLAIEPDMNQIDCGHCGSSLSVQRRVGTITLKLSAEAVSKDQSRTDKAAAEIALARLQAELDKEINRQKDFETSWHEEMQELKSWHSKTEAEYKTRLLIVSLVLTLFMSPPLIYVCVTLVHSMKSMDGLKSNFSTLLIGAFYAVSLVAALLQLSRKTLKDRNYHLSSIGNEMSSVENRLAQIRKAYDKRQADLRSKMEEQKRMIDS